MRTFETLTCGLINATHQLHNGNTITKQILRMKVTCIVSVELTIILVHGDVGSVNGVTVDLDVNRPSCGTLSGSLYTHSSDMT